jgi:PEP-CTERM motif
MSGRHFFKYGIATFALIGAAIAAAPASATVITFNLNTVLEGDTPSGFPTMTFDDGGSSGTVTLTIDAEGLSGQEFISAVLFNYADAATAADLVFTRTGGDGPAAGFTISQVADGENSPGNNGLFDIEFDYDTSNSGGGINRFDADELLTFSIVGDGITAGDFNVDSAPEGPDGDTNFAIARIQGIGPNGEGSASVGDGDGGGGGGGGIPVPEPAAIGLFGLGLLAVGLGRRRKRA